MKASFAVLLLAAVAQGCPSVPVAPDASSDAGTPSDATPGPADACAAGEATLLRLGCKDERGRPLGGPNLHGVGWAALCRENGVHGVDMKPACIAGSASCAAVSSCR